MKYFSKVISIFFLLLSICLFLVAPIFAHDSTDTSITPTVTTHPNTRDFHPFTKTFNATGTGSLKEGSLARCRAKESVVKSRMGSLSKLVNDIEGKFDKYTTMVEDYYTTKVLPSGHTVPNYSTLVANISTQKSAVEAALLAANNDASNFSCDGSNPTGQLKQFSLDMQKVKYSLQLQRKALKDLISAIRNVSKTGE